MTEIDTKTDIVNQTTNETNPSKATENGTLTSAEEPDPKRPRPNTMVSPEKKDQKWHVALFQDGTGSVFKTQQEMFAYMTKKNIPAIISSSRIKTTGMAMVKKHEQDYKQNIKDEKAKMETPQQQFSNAVEQPKNDSLHKMPAKSNEKVRIIRIFPHVD